MPPVTLISVNGGNICQGFSWEITAPDKLAEMVAHIAIGQYRHVEKIISGKKITSLQVTDRQKQGAIKLVTAKDITQPYHRDGWIFQAISWIVAHCQEPDAIIAKPQSRLADKGPDGLQVGLTQDSKNIAEIVVFEDKATNDAYNTVQNKVFPEILKIESGDKDHEFTTEICGVIDCSERSVPGANYEEQIGNILLEKKHCYRISIATDSVKGSQKDHKSIFKKFDEIATGSIVRRRTNTLHYVDLRKCMSGFADMVIEKIKGM